MLLLLLVNFWGLGWGSVGAAVPCWNGIVVYGRTWFTDGSLAAWVGLLLLGVQAKQGFVIYRVRVKRGGRKRPIHNGRTNGKPVNHGINEIKFARSLRSKAEERVGRKCGGLRVLNSYWVAEDGTYKFFEVIMVDPAHKAIRRDPTINWICNPVHKHRELRGLTSAGKLGRGMHKGHGHTKQQGSSRRNNWQRRNLIHLRRFR